MTEMKPQSAVTATVATPMLVMCLYIANSAPNSLQAVANLKAICAEYPENAYTLEIIDVLEFPERALADGVVVTPSLAKISPSPLARIIGNLSDKESVLQALGIER